MSDLLTAVPVWVWPIAIVAIVTAARIALRLAVIGVVVLAGLPVVSWLAEQLGGHT